MTQERDRWMKSELRTLERERIGSTCSYMSFFNCTTSQFFSMLCGTVCKERKLRLEATGENFDFLSLSFLKTGLQFMYRRQFFSIDIIFKILIFFSGFTSNLYLLRKHFLYERKCTNYSENSV